MVFGDIVSKARIERLEVGDKLAPGAAFRRMESGRRPEGREGMVGTSERL